MKVSVRNILKVAGILLLLGLGVSIYVMFTGSRQGESIAVLVGYEEGCYYTEQNGKLQRVEDGNWNQYMVDIKQQFYSLAAVTTSFADQYLHPVLFLDENLKVIKNTETRAGQQTYKLSKATAYVLVAAKKEEKVELQGILSDSGAKERAQDGSQNTPFSGKSVSVIGDSLSSFERYMPTDFYHHYPKGDMQVSDMWWYQVAKNLGMNINKINACGSAGVTALTWNDVKPEMAGSAARGKDLKLFDENPEVVFVWMGGNDLMAGASPGDFQRQYRKMVRDIQTAYPQAEIYLCTYYQGRVNYIDMRGVLHDEIRKIAEEFQVGLLDVEKSSITVRNQKQYFLDVEAGKNNTGLHPNKEGMQVISEFITEELLKNSK